MTRAALVLSLLALIGCGREERATTNTAVVYDPAIVPGKTAPPMAWRYAGSDETPEARFGAGADSSTFRLVCDRDGQALRVRHSPVADAPADAPMVLATSGQEKRLPLARREGALEGALLLADPFVAAMSAPAARVLVAVGASPPLDVPGGAAIRRVVEACRAPIEKRLDGAVYSGSVPGGTEVVMLFEAATPGPGRMTLLRRATGGGEVARVDGTVVIEEETLDGVVYRVDPLTNGETLWFEAPEADVILLRGPGGIPDPGLDLSPLARRR